MKKTNKQRSKWPFIITLIIFLFITAFILSAIISIFSMDVKDIGSNVAQIPIKGVIAAESSQDIFGMGVVSSTDIVQQIKKAEKNPTIKAIILEINSPGGSAVASDEIGTALKKVNKTKVAWIREVGASGGYWIASSSDHIIANKMSITGSIGVIGSYLEFAGLISDYNVTYRRLVSGKYKDMGSPFKEMTPKEESIFTKKLDTIHEIFINEVAINRGLSKEEMKRVSEAEFYLGTEALDLKLIDELGGKEEVIAHLEKELGEEVKIVEYKKKKTFFDILGDVFSYQSFFIGKGIGSEMFSKKRLVNEIDIIV